MSRRRHLFGGAGGALILYGADGTQADETLGFSYIKYKPADPLWMFTMSRTTTGLKITNAIEVKNPSGTMHIKNLWCDTSLANVRFLAGFTLIGGGSFTVSQTPTDFDLPLNGAASDIANYGIEFAYGNIGANYNAYWTDIYFD